ncbi:MULTISPECIES: hypothetical protein [Methylococcus]|uniref:Uncharacterized protein n=1 Tax=Methylococcus capsulatus (strain ATCC 33009 / NCIMB 11132 / Bath) TaxID=243233 RepID=Q602W4_METCA|nr:hypothetical protein [Methylococcus capsulatus]AAU90955.1 hypothetical protein MCA2944 [Methylococcus capsulatus str. Bath]QXP93020.1 hypothetical protein KW113_11700 [Methylococcus capsulatus]
MSHTKRSFIQACLIRALPALDRVDAGIAHAEALWERLTAKGYGAPRQTGPRESVDWYARLVEPSRGWFDQFWTAYGLKRDRNGAAMRWYQLGDLTEHEARRIIDAAKQDNRQWRETAQPGQVRKMAQGWLHEKRWMDYAPTPQPPLSGGYSAGLAGDAQLRELKQQLASLQRLNAAAPSKELQRQINELVQEIGNFQRPGHG